MIPYFILLLVTVVLAFISKKFRSNKGAYYAIIFFIFLLLVLFAGLRNGSVGTDTNNYINMFQSNMIVNISPFDSASTMEIGYLVLQYTVRLFSSESWLLLASIATIVIFFYLKTILILSEKFAMSMFLFITLATYLFFFNGARQGIAVAIFSFSLIALINAEEKKYYFWIFVSFLFHKSVLIALPFYYLLRKKVSLKNIIKLVIILFILVALFSQLLIFLPGDSLARYTQYVDSAQTGGELLTIFHIIMLSYFIYMRQFISYSRKEIYDIYLNLAIVFTSVFVIVGIFGMDVGLLRIAMYFSLGSILIWPIIFKEISRKIKPLIYLFFIIGHLMFLYIYIGKISDLNPYLFNINI